LIYTDYTFLVIHKRKISMRKFAVLSLAAFAAISLLSLSTIHGRVNADQKTATATKSSGTQPLTLLWETHTLDDVVLSAGFVAVDNLGNSYVDSSSGHPIKEFDTNGKFVATFGSRGTGDGQFIVETGIAVDSQRNLYVNDFENVRVQKFDGSGKFLVQWPTEAPNGPTGIAVDSKGNVYVANHLPHDHYLQKFDSTGKLLTEWGSTGTGDGQFMAGATIGIGEIAVDNQDNIYVTDPGNNRIEKFDSDGKFLAQFGSYGLKGNGKFDKPLGIAVDMRGNIYVIDGNFLQKLAPDGTFLAQWSTALKENDLGGATFVAVDGQGDIYVIAKGSVPGADLKIPILKKFKQP
jgi:tripartite motif-containing protein 71